MIGLVTDLPLGGPGACSLAGHFSFAGLGDYLYGHTLAGFFLSFTAPLAFFSKFIAYSHIPAPYLYQNIQEWNEWIHCMFKTSIEKIVCKKQGCLSFPSPAVPLFSLSLS
jgi:hypothetical protein